MTWQEGLDYAVMLLGLAGALEQFYVLRRPSWMMVWIGIAQFVLGAALQGLRARRMAPPGRQGH